MARSVLITGCSEGGLGAALAAAFHEKGYRVIATARNLSKMSSLKTMGIDTLTLDVVSDASVEAAVDQVSALTDGSLDILINNAGAGYYIPLMDASLTEMQKLFDLNVIAAVRVTQRFLPLLLKSGAGALLVNNTSVAGTMTMPWQGAYNASKAAMAMVSDTLRLELKPFGIKVVDLKTGVVQSHFYDNVTASAQVALLPEDSLYGAARDKIESFIKGEVDVQFTPAEEWAREVVKDLVRTTPPARIWRGHGAFLVWAASFMPFGTFDWYVRRLSGLEFFEHILKNRQKSGDNREAH